MKKVHRETQKVLLDNEKEVLKELKESFTQSLAEIKKKMRKLEQQIRLLEETEADESLIRSKIYQLNFQKSLEKQINNSMIALNDTNTLTVETYLKKMYEDGFLTQLYVVESFDIPCVLPINQDLLIQSVNKKVEDYKFSKRLYDDVMELAEKVKQEITNGFAQGKGYAEIAKAISGHTTAAMKRAYTIARTEGARVNNEARYEAQKAAKKNGADIVKQWDCTLDLKTRPSHQTLDGQIREINEDYEIDGYKAKEPTMFGVAYLDINCRCASLTMPRWDIDPTVKKRDNISGKIIECKNYYDWKEKYYKEVKKDED